MNIETGFQPTDKQSLEMKEMLSRLETAANETRFLLKAVDTFVSMARIAMVTSPESAKKPRSTCKRKR